MLVSEAHWLLQKALGDPSPDRVFFDTLLHKVAIEIDLIAKDLGCEWWGRSRQDSLISCYKHPIPLRDGSCAEG